MKITKIISVEDTRQWEEGPDDRWYPIPGSGIKNNCGRCGREHEVHAVVELENNSQMIVGTGCMKADEAEIGNRIRSVLGAQKTLRKYTAILAKKGALHAEATRIRREVDAMRLPPVEKTSWMRAVGRKEEIHGFKMGDARVSSGQMMHPTDSEMSSLIWSWKDGQCKVIGMTADMQHAYLYVDEAKARIKRAEEKIEEKLK